MIDAKRILAVLFSISCAVRRTPALRRYTFTAGKNAIADRSVCVFVSVWWLSEVCVSVVRVSAVLRPVCLPLRVRPRVCPVPELRFVNYVTLDV